MDTGGSVLYGVDATRRFADIHGTLRNSHGIVAGRYSIYARRQENGSVRAQFELRSAGDSSVALPSGNGLVAIGYEDRWPGIMVEVDKEQGKSSSVRLSVDIPGETAGTSVSSWHAETPLAPGLGQVGSVEALLLRCRDTEYSDAAIHFLAAYRRMRKLEDDRGIAELVALASFIPESQNIGA